MTLLEGKAIVVTGAGQGLGRAYAVNAASRGAAVVVNDVDATAAEQTVAEIRTAGGNATAAVGSVGDWSYCEQLIDRCIRTNGKIDGLVNNAGLFYVSPPWEDDEERIRRLIEVNVLGTLFCGAHAMRRMIDQRSGSIVNVTSGAHAGMPGMSTYGGSKGAVASYTYAAAIDAMPHNVRVNAISPIAMTRMALARDGAVSDTVEFDPTATGERAGLAAIPPENVAPLVTFLLSDRSASVTGQVIRLQGRQLSLVEHPVVTEPGESSDAWSPEAIAEAFDRSLGVLLRPVGMGAKAYRWAPES